MSEIKGTLLGIVLAISLFSIVFGIITVAMNTNSHTVADKMRDSVQVEPEITTESAVAYTLP